MDMLGEATYGALGDWLLFGCTPSSSGSALNFPAPFRSTAPIALSLGNNYSIDGGTKWGWLARLRTWLAVLQIWSLNKLCSFRKRDNYILVWPVHVYILTAVSKNQSEFDSALVHWVSP